MKNILITYLEQVDGEEGGLGSPAERKQGVVTAEELAAMREDTTRYPDVTVLCDKLPEPFDKALELQEAALAAYKTIKDIEPGADPNGTLLETEEQLRKALNIQVIPKREGGEG